MQTYFRVVPCLPMVVLSEDKAEKERGSKNPTKIEKKGAENISKINCDVGAGSLGTKISPKPDLETILGAKIGPRRSQNRSKRAPRRIQEGQKRKAASYRRPETRPDDDCLAMSPVLGPVLEAKIKQNRFKNAATSLHKSLKNKTQRKNIDLESQKRSQHETQTNGTKSGSSTSGSLPKTVPKKSLIFY